MADEININGSDRERVVTRERVVDGSDGGMSGLIWAILILLLLVIAYFVFIGRDNDVDTTVPQEINQTTEQNDDTTAPADGTGTQTETDTNTDTTTDTNQ